MKAASKPATRAQSDALVRTYVAGVEWFQDASVRESAQRSQHLLVEYLFTEQGRHTSERVRKHMRLVLASSKIGRLTETLDQVNVFRRLVEDFERWSERALAEVFDRLPPEQVQALSLMSPEAREALDSYAIDKKMAGYAKWFDQMDAMSAELGTEMRS